MLFIGSSSESLDVAYAAQRNLEDVAEVVVWTQGIFELTKSYLEALMDALDDTEFGLFIFGPDDVMRIRGEEMRIARDNVVFELGLFIGRLGRERSFILMPRGVSDLHLPSDLLGISTATYQPPTRPDRLQAALGPACHDIRTAIRKHVTSHGKGADLQELQNKVVAQEGQLEDQQNLINQLVKTSMSPDVFHHLAGVTILHNYLYRQQDGVVGDEWEREFYDLKHRGFIEGKQGEICEFGPWLNRRNVREIVQPTRIGLLYVKLRKEDIPKEWLSTDPKKRENLNIDVARKLGLEIADDSTISAS